MRSPLIIAAIAALLVGSSAARSALEAQTGSAATSATRLQALEDREAIRALMNDYGRTLDSRDFAAFGRLWARESEFLGGGGNSAKGPAAIQALLEKLLKMNGAPMPGRDFHLVFNQTIDVIGDRATALSKGGWMVTTPENRLQMQILADYHDEYVREDGRWKFKRRQIGNAR